MIGTRISHYRVDDRLGPGGLGEVFLAHDLALGRSAAIKVLPASFRPELRTRLLREAEASRRLQHPGIATFFEAGEHDGVAFIAMEYVRGRTLRARLREGQLAPAEAVAVATSLLEALGHAHAAGIVHRDLKPENVMIAASGGTKLLDFGLALHEAGDAADSVTRTHVAALDSVVSLPGTITGSVGYMAPEQIEGREVDARADLFAVAAVLYELLSGVPAFGGANLPARIAATLFTDPPPLDGPRAGAWSALAKSLAQSPDERHATAAEFLRDLRRADEGTVLAATTPGTIAVLDFRRHAGDDTDGWIGSGIAETLGADLSRFAGARLVPRARVAAALAQAPDAPPSAIGARLGCRWAVSGGVQRLGPALRIVLEVTHVPTERSVLVEKFDGTLDELFAIQDRIGARAAEALALGERTAATASAPALGAYECWTRGRQHWIRMAKGGFERAHELYEDAIQQQPDYADPLAGLGAIHGLRFTFTTDPKELDAAIAFTRRALAVDPNHVEAHVWLAYALWRRGTMDEALDSIRHATALDPSNHYPPYFHACMLLSKEQFEAALPLYQRAVDLSPGVGFAWLGLGSTHGRLGRLAEARFCLERAIELETQGFHATSGAAGVLGETLRRAGALEEARAACLAGLESVERSDHMYRDTFRAICLNALGRTALDCGDVEAARAAFHQSVLHLGGRPRTLGGGHLACQAHAGLARTDGDAEELALARRAYANRAPGDWSWFWQCEDFITLEDLNAAGGPS